MMILAFLVGFLMGVLAVIVADAVDAHCEDQ